MFPKNRGTPKSSILIRFSIIHHPFWGKTPYFWKHPYSITPWPFTQTHPTNHQCLLLQTLLYKLTDASGHCLWAWGWFWMSCGNVRVMSCERTVGGKIMSHEKNVDKCRTQPSKLLSFGPLPSNHSKQRLRWLHFMAVKMCFPNLAYQFGYNITFLNINHIIHEMFPIFNHYLTTEINRPRQ